MTIKELGLLQKISSQEIRFKDDNGQDYPDWEEKRIKDLGEIVTGNTPSTKVKSYYENGTILWVTPTDISDEMYIFDTERKLTSLGINKAHFLPKGSVLITCIASIGKMTILGEDGSCNQQINAIIPNSDNDSIFILSLLRTLVPVMFIFAGKTATPIINKKTFSRIKCFVPCLAEQKKISDFLTTFDKRITAQQNIVADLEETKKGLLQKIFSQEIRFKDENGQDYPDWEEKMIKEVCFINPKSDCIENKFYYIDIGSVDMGMVSFQEPIDVENAPSRAQRVLKEGDILFQTVRPYQMGHYYFKKCNNLQTVASTGYAQLRCREHNEAIFIYQLLYTSKFNKEINLRCTGTSYPAINSSEFASIKIRIPMYNEQRKIADFLSTFDKKITAEKQILSDLQEIKKGLLQQMFV